MNECSLSANVSNAPNPNRGITNKRFLKPADRLEEKMLFEIAGLLDGADSPLLRRSGNELPINQLAGLCVFRNEFQPFDRTRNGATERAIASAPIRSCGDAKVRVS
jgi:hypothetical protein